MLCTVYSIRIFLHMSHFCACTMYLFMTHTWCTCVFEMKVGFTVVSCHILFSHVHSSPHISNDSFITTFTSEMTGCKFPHSLYCSCTCDAITCVHFSLASSPGSPLHACHYCTWQPLNPLKKSAECEAMHP